MDRKTRWQKGELQANIRMAYVVNPGLVKYYTCGMCSADKIQNGHKYCPNCGTEIRRDIYGY